MDNKKKLLFMKKTIYFKRPRLLKLMIFIRFPVSKSSIIGNYSTQNVPLRDVRIQPVLVWKYSVTRLWGFNQWNLAKKIKMEPQTFKYLLNMIRPGIEKMWFFKWDCLSYNRPLWNSLICFLFVSQF